MKVAFTNKYEKQFDRIPDAKTRRQIAASIASIIEANRLDEIPSTKKLKGFANAYRVRSGQFRIGLICESDSSVLVAA